jgi:hypothetical protein
MDSIDIKQSLLKNNKFLSKNDLPLSVDKIKTGSFNLDNIKNKINELGCGEFDLFNFSKLKDSLNFDIDFSLSKLKKIDFNLDGFNGINLELYKIIEELYKIIEDLMDGIDFDLNLEKLEFKLNLIRNLSSNASIGRFKKFDLDGINSLNDIKNKLSGFNLSKLNLPNIDLNLDFDSLLEIFRKLQINLKDLNLGIDINSLKDFLDGINLDFSNLGLPEIDFKIDDLTNAVLDSFNLDNIVDEVENNLEELLDDLGCVTKLVSQETFNSAFKNVELSINDKINAKTKNINSRIKNKASAAIEKSLSPTGNSKKDKLKSKLKNKALDVLNKTDFSNNSNFSLPFNINNPLENLSGTNISDFISKGKELIKLDNSCQIKEELLKSEEELILEEGDEFLDNLPKCLNEKIEDFSLLKNLSNPFEDLDIDKELIKEKLKDKGKDKLDSYKAKLDLLVKEKENTLKTKGINFINSNINSKLGIDPISENIDLHSNISAQVEGLLNKKKEALINKDLLPALQTELINFNTSFASIIKNKVGKDFNTKKLLEKEMNFLNEKSKLLI